MGSPTARASRRPWAAAAALALALVGPAAAEIRLPPGFTASLYVSGQGFETGRGGQGIPAVSSLAFDHHGALYLARTGRRYWSAGEADDLVPIYRVPAGGGRITPETERRFLHGPPLPNPQASAARDGLELFLTTFDRDRRLGVLYRLHGARPVLVAGGTPAAGQQPLLRQPEGVAVDSSEHVYVADRDAGAVLRLDGGGRVLDPRHVLVRRPRLLVVDRADTLWIGSDGDAEAPWQAGPGEIWRVARGEAPARVYRGPLASGLALDAAGRMFVANRSGGEIFLLGPDGTRVPFARYDQGDAPRALAFAPITPETRRAGIAGDLFVVTIQRGAWPVNDVVRIAGPFGSLAAGAR